MTGVAVTIPLAEEGEKEEAVNAQIGADAFEPHAPFTQAELDGFATYEGGEAFAAGAFVFGSDGKLYRAKEEVESVDPTEDTEHEKWAPVAYSAYALQNPDYLAGFTPTVNPSRKEP